MPELRVTGGTILTMDPAGTVIADGLLVAAGGRLTYCGPRADAPPAGPGARTLEAGGGLILPGMVNCHTHAAMTLLRGLADDLPLDRWLNEHIFPAERRITRAAVRWGTLLACAEMIKNGITAFCDMYLFAAEVARAADQAGMRALVGEVVYDFPSPAYGEVAQGLAWTEELILAYRDHPRVRGVVMPHATYTCAPSLWEKLGRLAGDLGADLNTHLAETPQETAEIVARHGQRPLAFLEGMGLVNPRLMVNHAVDFDQGEIERLAERGVRVAHCPESNLKLASGVMNLPAMLRAGVKVGLGTDGCASNNDLDLFGEMGSCARLHKAHWQDPTVASAPEVFSLATHRAGEVLGVADLGMLKAGAPADLMVVDLEKPHLVPLHNPLSQLVYAARGSDVRHTVCHGEVLMEDRRLLTLDEAEVIARAREEAARLRGAA